MHGSAWVAACSASPGASYAIEDDDDAEAGVDATAPEDATVPEDARVDASAPGEDAAADTAIPSDATVPEDAAEPVDADASEDAGADAAADAEPDVDAGPPPPPRTLLRLEGRWDRALPDTPRAAFPGARITMRFHGTGAVLRLLEKKSFRSFEGTSQWSVRIDGALGATLITQVEAANNEETRDYVVADGLPLGEHTVQLVRRTEAEFGSTRLIDLTVTDGQMLTPPAPPVHRLEFVGDSNMSGYGVEVTRPMNSGDPPCSHTPSNQNFEKAFPALVAARFGAEIETAIHSGKGVFYNQTRTDLTTIPMFYPRSVPSESATAYDASGFAAEAVVVLAGGNDYAERVENDYPSEADVQTAYDGLLGQIRTAHPGALVVATLSPGVSDGSPVYAAPHPLAGQSVMVRSKLRASIQQVVDARVLAGDGNLVFHEFAQVGGDQLSACHYHPGPALHATLAQSLGDLLAARLGW